MPALPADEVRNVRVSAHSIMLPRGKFCISVAEVTPGLPPELLPGLSVSVIPGDGSQVRLGALPGTEWLRLPGDAVLLEVASAQARILLTSYNMAEATDARPPRMQIQRLDLAPPAPAAAPPPAPPAAPPTAPAAPDGLMVHMARLGDRQAPLGAWAGESQDGVWIEGLQVTPPEGLAAEELEYQVVLGKGWTSPWSQGNEFCGSRGMTLPVQGLRVALRGDAARRWEVRCEAETASGIPLGPVGAEELCGLEEPEPLARIRLSILPRAAGAAPRAPARRGTRR
ncbi:hypothetical protein ACI6QG_16985 [Roseococcus sp. DSY-14]|uniref:hypothetical protein n=1 Tax=Roseococcus sp. DSY-14 TaxID=3369650 RepID=UPI00387B13AE